jgi:hypothetical protein
MFLANISVHFGHIASTNCSSQALTHNLLNLKFASYVFQAVYFNWVIHSFSNGHFASTIQLRHQSFHVSLACDTSELRHSIFNEFTPDAKVFSSGNDFWASGETLVVHGYLINFYCFWTSKVTTSFWKLQLSISA